MKVTKEINSFYELWKQSWSGAIDTLKVINRHDKEDDLIEYLEIVFYNGTDETTLNNYLWFKRDEIFIVLGIEDD